MDSILKDIYFHIGKMITKSNYTFLIRDMFGGGERKRV